MSTKTLQDLFPEYELMTVAGCVARLGWTTERGPGDPRGTGAITCKCGGAVKVSGWVGPEHAWCPECGAGMQDMTGLLPSGPSSAAVVDFENVALPEDDAVWVAENVWGFR